MKRKEKLILVLMGLFIHVQIVFAAFPAESKLPVIVESRMNLCPIDRALFDAIDTCDFVVVDKCVGLNANVNVQDCNGDTPLHLVAKYHKNIIDLIFVYGLSFDASSETQLYTLRCGNYRKILLILLHSGADPKIENNSKKKTTRSC